MDTIVTSDTLRLVRVFDASRERFFDAWTDAEQFKAWMCPPGAGIDRCEIDARPGGKWLAHGYQPNGARFAKAGVMLNDLELAVERPKQLFISMSDSRYKLLMPAMDAINARYGRNTVSPMAVGVTRPWATRSRRLSQQFTTKLTDVLAAQAW